MYSTLSSNESNNINKYLLISIIVILLISISLFIYLLVKQDQQTKDENLKIALNIINRENYENESNNRNKRQCLKLKSALGDSNNKGLNDIYKNIMGKTSPLSPSNIDCDKMNDSEMTDLKFSFFQFLNSMLIKSVENKDEEKAYYDITSLFLLLAKLLSESNEKVISSVDSNGKIISVELKGQDGKDLTISKLLDNYITPSSVPSSTIHPEIEKQKDETKKIISKKSKDIKDNDLDKLRNDKETKMNIKSLGKVLILGIYEKGSLVK